MRELGYLALRQNDSSVICQDDPTRDSIDEIDPAVGLILAATISAGLWWMAFSMFFG